MTPTPFPTVRDERSDREDRRLVERVKTGDHEAFEVLFRRYVSLVYRQAFKLTGNAADAQDVVQDVFLALYEKAGTFRGEAAVSTWLFRLTVNTAFTKLRRRKKGIEVSLEDFLPQFRGDGHHQVRPVSDWSEGVDDLLLQREFRRAVQKAVESLRPVDKAVVVLSDMEGLSNREICEALGLSLLAVKARLHRSRLFLRGRLAVHLGYSPT